MFIKYMGKFKNAEAEWVQEVLDMCEGSQSKAAEMLFDATDRIVKRNNAGQDLDTLDRTIEACGVANPLWWAQGLARLKELGGPFTNSSQEGLNG